MAEMVKQTKSTEVKMFESKKLPTPVKYSWTWTNYPDFETLEKAGDTLSNEEQLKFRNDERELKARGKAQTAALKAAGFEKSTEENNPQIALKNMVKTLMTKKNPDGTSKHTLESARALASQLLETEWEDEA